MTLTLSFSCLVGLSRALGIPAKKQAPRLPGSGLPLIETMLLPRRSAAPGAPAMVVSRDRRITYFYIVVFLYFFAVFPSKLKKSIWMQNQFSILVYN